MTGCRLKALRNSAIGLLIGGVLGAGCRSAELSRPQTVTLRGADQGRRTEADRLRRAGKHDDAITLYEKLLAEPSTGRRGDLALREGVARAFWERAGRRGMQAPTAATISADQDSAVRYLREALDLALGDSAPADADVCAALVSTLGTYLQESGRTDEAIAQYERLLDGPLAAASKERVRLLHELGNTYYRRSGLRDGQPITAETYRADLDRAFELQQAALRATENLEGLAPSLLASIHNSLGLIHGSRFESTAAIGELTAAVEVLERNDDPHLLGEALGNLITELAEAGRMDEVDRRYTQLESLPNVLRDPRLTAVLAMANLKRGRFAEAQQGFDMAIHLANRDERCREDLNFMTQLRCGAATCAQEIGAFTEAERHLRDAEEALVGGQVDPRTAAVVQANLGRLYLTLERPDDAEPVLEKLLTVLRDTSGGQDPDTLKVLLDLAKSAQLRGHESEALRRCTEAVEGLLKIRGADDPSVADAQLQLASVYRDQGRCDEALGNAQRAMSTLDKSFGVDHKRSVLACLQAALIAADCRTTEEGERAFDLLQQEASRRFGVLRSQLGTDNVEVLRALVYFADVSAKTPTAMRGALARYEEAEAGFRGLVGDGGPTVASLRLRRGRLLEQLGQPDEALQLYELALGDLDRSFNGHVVRSELLASLGDAFHQRGDYDKARECWDTSVRILAELYGRDDPRVTGFMDQRRR